MSDDATLARNLQGKALFLNPPASEEHPADKKPASQLNKANCRNIIESCYHLEHLEKFKNQKVYAKMDKEKILADERQHKLNGMIAQMEEFNEATNPQALRKMFVYHDHIKKEEEEESRTICKSYHKAIMDPFRHCAKIELRSKSRRQKQLPVSQGRHVNCT